MELCKVKRVLERTHTSTVIHKHTNVRAFTFSDSMQFVFEAFFVIVVRVLQNYFYVECMCCTKNVTQLVKKRIDMHKVYLVATGNRKFIERFFVKFFALCYAHFVCVCVCSK